MRPTAFFKSLAGQIERVKGGRPFLMFGDGALTACKPIDDDDFGDYIAGCLDDPARWNAVLPIGGPGPAITPREQGERLFALMGRPPKLRRVPIGLLDAVIGACRRWAACRPPWPRRPSWRASAATTPPSPCWCSIRSRAATTPRRRPRWERARCSDFYADVLAGAPLPDRGDHAVFRDRPRERPQP